GEGLVEWLFTAPAALGSGGAELNATWREGPHVSREELRIEWTQGPAAALTVSSSERVAHYGGAPVSFEARVADALGRPRPGAMVTATTSLGAASAVADQGGGRHAFSWTPPGDGTANRVDVVVRASGPTGSLPSRIVAWTERDNAFLAAVDLAGAPVPDQSLRVGERLVRTGADGVVAIGALASGAHEIRHEQWTGLRLMLHVLAPGMIWPAEARPGTAEHRTELMIAPPIPINVRVAIAGREVTWWAEDATGRIIPHRRLAVHVEGAQLSRPRTADGRTSATLAGRARAQISVADVETGITAVAEAPP
ncbi:MAG TPA: hypothetical protein VE618_06875, partial [Myxococcaceae bacterium]|nr:hypothetical protein [Myxococcaceae bacterium]